MTLLLIYPFILNIRTDTTGAQTVNTEEVVDGEASVWVSMCVSCAHIHVCVYMCVWAGNRSEF